MRTRPKITIPGALGIVAIYASLFAAARSLGAEGFVCAGVSGTAIAIASLFGESRDIPSVTSTAVGTVMGAFLGVMCLGQLILVHEHGYDHGFGETAESEIKGGIMGAIGGGIIASALHHLRSQSTKTPDSH